MHTKRKYASKASKVHSLKAQNQEKRQKVKSYGERIDLPGLEPEIDSAFNVKERCGKLTLQWYFMKSRKGRARGESRERSRIISLCSRVHGRKGACIVANVAYAQCLGVLASLVSCLKG